MSKEAMRQEAVFEACRRVVDRALPLTARNVRHEMGGGSFSTLMPLLNEFKSKASHETALRSALPPPSEDFDLFVKKMISEIWIKSKISFTQEAQTVELNHKRETERLQRDLSEAQEEISGSCTEIKRLEEALKVAEERVEELNIACTAKEAQLALLMQQTKQKDLENAKLMERAIQAESLVKRTKTNQKQKEKVQR